jgi:hypothetical protein
MTELQENSGSIEELKRQAAKLKKINAALMSRVERSMDQQFNAFRSSVANCLTRYGSERPSTGLRDLLRRDGFGWLTSATGPVAGVPQDQLD